MNCPFCKEQLAEEAELHVLACSLAEICMDGPQIDLAKRCEKAYAERRSAPTNQS